MNKNINAGKSKSELSNFKPRSSPKCGERAEVFGPLLAVVSGFVPAARTYPLLLQHAFDRLHSSPEPSPYLLCASPLLLPASC